jgi:hypothetical protein
VIPAPLTWFPPGYSAAIALATSTGCSGETAALWISIAAFALVTAGVWRLTRMLDRSRWTARTAVLCWIVNSQALYYSGAALSESLFTLLGLAGLLFAMRAAELEDARQIRVAWILAAIMAGLAFWVRYAGILWVVSLLALMSAQLVFRMKGARLWRIGLAAAALLACLVLPLIIRNLVLVGDWRGGNNTGSPLALRDFVAHTPGLLLHLAFGDVLNAKLLYPIAVMSAGLIGLGFITLKWATGFSTALREALSHPPANATRIFLPATILYSAGLAAITLRSPVTYEARMYVPVLPNLIVLAVVGLAFVIRRLPASGWPRRAGLGMAFCIIAGYAAANYVSGAETPPDAAQTTREALRGPDGDGLPLERRLLQELRPGEVIAATNGQVAGFVLNHPVLSLAGRPWSPTVWSEASLRTNITRFGARHLLIFCGNPPYPAVQASPFLHALAKGQAAPWLTLVACNREVCVYRVL